METQNPAKCHLLHLPREIRDQIYSDVLDTPSLAPPICPTEADDCIEEDQGWACGYYQKTFSPISCLSILLCNRLIGAEMSELIARKNNNKKTALRYKLDLMIWDCDLQPTWLSLPVPLKYVKTVEVDIRFFRYGGPQWASHPTVLSQYLLQLLRRFLTNGPVFIRSHSLPELPLHRPPHLDNLTITFIPMLQKTSPSSPSNYQVLDFPGQELDADDFLKAEVNAYIRLSKYVALIANSGLLFGKIKTLQLRYETTGGDDGGMTNVYDVKDVGILSLAEEMCSRYGWGPVLERTQKMVDGGGIEYCETLDCLPRDPNMPVEQSYWSEDPLGPL